MCCRNCGKEIPNNSHFCPECGNEVNTSSPATFTPASTSNSKEEVNAGLDIAIKIFMIIVCILLASCIIPFCWCIPMTVSAFKSIDNHKKIGTGMSICTLLFVSVIAGILMLIRDND